MSLASQPFHTYDCGPMLRLLQPEQVENILLQGSKAASDPSGDSIRGGSSSSDGVSSSGNAISDTGITRVLTPKAKRSVARSESDNTTVPQHVHSAN